MENVRAINNICYPDGNEYRIEDLLFVKEDNVYFPLIIPNIVEKPLTIEIPIKKMKKILQLILELED